MDEYGTIAMSRFGYHDRRGFDASLKGSLILVALSLFVLVLYSWKIGLALVLFFMFQFITYERMSAPPPNEPRAFVDWSSTQVKRRPTILCLGDSLTHGAISANITPEIPMKVAAALGMETPVYGKIFNDPVWVVNAGENSLTSHVILHERLSKAMGTFPDYIVLLVGTNDVLSMYHPFLKKYIARLHGLTENQQTMAVYESNINGIIRFIRESSPRVELGVCTLPPIGEDLHSKSNQLIRQANSIIERAVAAADDERTSVIPVFTEFESTIEKKRRRQSVIPFDIALVFSGVLYRAYIWFSSCGMTWNLLGSFLFGNVVTTEGIHLNETGRDIVVDLIVEWLMRKNIPKVIALKAL